MRIAALGDLHYPRGRRGDLAKRLQGLEQHADVLVLCGDLTDSGDPHDARGLVAELTEARVPMVAVLGNHDHECGQVEAVRAILGEAGVHVLDGDSFTIGEVGFAGTKGFGGGFGKRRVISFGEEATKRFVEEGIREAQKLEQALRSLETPKRIALTHYAPVLGTVVGEAPEIIPFLGNSDLGAAADHAGADLMFHGHCHFGRPESHTDRGIPVYNCATAVLDHLRPPRRFTLVDSVTAAERHPVPSPPGGQ